MICKDGSDSKKSRLALTVSANQAPLKCMQIKMCKHQQLFDSRDALVPKCEGSERGHRRKGELVKISVSH